MFHHRQAFLGPSLLALLCASALAEAGNNYDWDRKTMTGAQCQPSTGSQWGDFVVNPDGIRNIAAANRYISCTVPIDSETNIDQADFDLTTAAGRMDGYLKFDYSLVPATGTYTTTCTLFNKHWTTNATTASTTVSVTSGRTTSIVSGFFAGTTFNGIGTLGGAFAFNCRLPPQVKLVRIYWAESSKSDGYYYTP